MTAIMLAQMASAAVATPGEGARVNINPHTVTTVHNNGSLFQLVQFITRNTGKLDFFAITDGPQPGDPPNEWIVGHPDTVEAALYETRVTEISQFGNATRLGSAAWEADNTIWIDCATSDTNRIWQMTKDTIGDANWVLTVDIRHKVSMTIHGTATITLFYIDDIS